MRYVSRGNFDLAAADREDSLTALESFAYADHPRKTSDKRFDREHHFRMQNVVKCSFCQKPQGMVRSELASPQTSAVSICPDCLTVCRRILKKETKPIAESGNYKRYLHAEIWRSHYAAPSAILHRRSSTS